MSYEGWTQVLCKNGHEFSIGQYEDRHPCPHCGAEIVWSHEVDLTNGCEPDCKLYDKKCYAHPLELEIATPAVYEHCPTCQHKRVVFVQIYKIPAESGGAR